MKHFSSISSKIIDGNHGIVAVCSFSAILMGSLLLVRWNADANWDGVLFLSVAKRYATAGFDEGFIAWGKFPLYPFLISLMQNIIPNWVAAGRLISYFATIVVATGVYYLTRDLFDHKAAFFGSITFSLLPETLLQSTSINRDPCFLAIFIWALFFCAKSAASKNILHSLAGLFLLLLSSMFRLEGLIIIPIYGCMMIVMAFKREDQRRRYCYLISLWAIIPLCIILSGYFIMKSNNMFRGYLNDMANTYNDYINLKIFENYDRITSQLQQMNDVTPQSDTGVHFSGAAKRIAPLIFLIGLLHMLVNIILIVNIMPLLYGIRNSAWLPTQSFIFVSAVGYFSILYFYFIWYDQMLTRWLFPVAVMICPWIGFGINEILKYIKKLPYTRIAGALFLFLILFTSITGFDKYFRKNDDLASRTGNWIYKQDIFKNSTIIFNDPVVAFYAGRDIYSSRQGDSIFYPNVDDKYFSEIERFSIEKQAEYIVLNVRNERINMITPFSIYEKLKNISDGNRTMIIFSSTK
jgi:hypothetical protein